jgi:hypothetical protein
MVQGLDSIYDGSWMQEGVIGVNIAKVCFEKDLSIVARRQSLRMVSRIDMSWA